MTEHVMIRSGHVDTFARDNLPPREQWPEFRFTLPELQYPERLNCVTEFVDKWVAGGGGDRIAIVSPYETWTYAQLAERINRIANVLTRDLGMVPGNRVLLHGANSPELIACCALLDAWQDTSTAPQVVVNPSLIPSAGIKFLYLRRDAGGARSHAGEADRER